MRVERLGVNGHFVLEKTSKPLQLRVKQLIIDNSKLKIEDKFWNVLENAYLCTINLKTIIYNQHYCNMKVDLEDTLELIEEVNTEEWTAEEEREAFLLTSKLNATRNFSQQL